MDNKNVCYLTGIIPLSKIPLFLYHWKPLYGGKNISDWKIIHNKYEYSAGQKFRTCNAMSFLWPPWERGANFEHGGV